jgi:hypothetical protein
VRGEPGCCCLDDGSCTPIERRKRVEFIYSNVCNSEKLCVLEALPPAKGGKCDGHDAGSSWQEADKTCHCTDFGKLCDTLDCYALKQAAACDAKSGCHFGSNGYFGDGCYNKVDYPNVTPAPGLGGSTAVGQTPTPTAACLVNADGEYYCENGERCDTVTVTCPPSTDVPSPSASSGSTMTLASVAMLLLALIVVV